MTAAESNHAHCLSYGLKSREKQISCARRAKGDAGKSYACDRRALFDQNPVSAKNHARERQQWNLSLCCRAPGAGGIRCFAVPRSN